MEIREYLGLLRRWWWLVVVLAIAGGSLGFFLTPEPTPLYRSTVRLLLNPGQSDAGATINVRNAQALATTYSQLMRSRPLLETVIANLALTQSPDGLASKIAVTWVEGTSLIQLTVTDTDPLRASLIANEMVRAFLEQNALLEAERFISSKENIQLELAQVQVDLEAAQLENFQFERELAPINENLQELSALEIEQGSLTQAQTQQRDQLEAQLAEKLVEGDALNLKLSNLRARHQSLLSSFEELRRLEAQTSTVMTIVEDAQPGVRITGGSKKVINAVQAAVAGAVAGLGIIALFEYFRVSVKTTDEVTKATGLSTLGIISEIKASSPAQRLVTATQPRSSMAEAYRVLRANIEFLSGDNLLRTIVVTSTVPVEGKTTSSANLAIAIAQSGKRVILVDTDLRRPSLHKLFQQPNTRGVTTALLQETNDLEEHLVMTQVEGLHLMPSGPLPPNPADLLGSPQMLLLIERLKQCADIVIFDTPPALVVADASLLARKTDTTLLVVLAGSTSAEMLRKAQEQLTQSGANLMGVILNRVKAGGGGNYYYYYGHGG